MLGMEIIARRPDKTFDCSVMHEFAWMHDWMIDRLVEIYMLLSFSCLDFVQVFQHIYIIPLGDIPTD